MLQLHFKMEIQGMRVAEGGVKYYGIYNKNNSSILSAVNPLQ